MSEIGNGSQQKRDAEAINPWKWAGLMRGVWIIAIIYCVGAYFVPVSIADQEQAMDAEAKAKQEPIIAGAAGTLDEGQMLFLERLAEKRFVSRWTELTPE